MIQEKQWEKLWACLETVVMDRNWKLDGFLEQLRMFYLNSPKSRYEEGLRALVEYMIQSSYGLKVTIEVPEKEIKK